MKYLLIPQLSAVLMSMLVTKCENHISYTEHTGIVKELDKSRESFGENFHRPLNLSSDSSHTIQVTRRLVVIMVSVSITLEIVRTR